MKEEVTPDEKSKRQIAKDVVTPKRRYFVPDHGRNVEADSPEEAVKLAKKEAEKEAEKAESAEGDDANGQ